MDKLAEEVGLYIFARPGPYICSEWDFGGFPNWLIPKECELRSSEPHFLQYCASYLDKINEILCPHQITRKGNVILYQIENEFEVGDLAYHLRLKQMVEEDGIDLPIITNENAWLRGSEIIEGPDPYLRSEDLSGPMRRIKDLIRTQPDKPPFAPEVGCHMFSRFGEPLPFADGYVSPDVDEAYLKALIAAGVCGFNYYMYHGGTNLGYWTSRGVTTTYDFDAPIREWGELGARYYVGRLLGGFLEAFGNILLETLPREGLCSSKEIGVEVFSRTNGKTSFIFLWNAFAEKKSFSLNIRNPGSGKNLAIPHKNCWELPGYSMHIIPVSLRLSPCYTLLYSTSEIFYFLDHGEEKTLIVYGETGLRGEIALQAKGSADLKIESIRGCQIKDGILYLNYTHQSSPQFMNIRGKEILTIIVLNKKTASHTWFFTYKGKQYPLISNLYLLEKDEENGKSLTLTFQLRGGKNWAVIPLSVKGIKSDNEKMCFLYDEANKTTNLTFPEVKIPHTHHNLAGRWKVKEDNEEAGGRYDDSSWIEWEPWKSLEHYGFLDNGYAWYRTYFPVRKVEKPLYLDLTGFQDEATVYLNGKYLTNGKDCLREEITPFIGEGENHLAILVESIGHEKLGERSLNGITCPVYISSEKQEFPLRRWRRRVHSKTYPERALVRKLQPEVNPGFNDEEWEKVKVDWNWDSRAAKHPFEEVFCWYRTKMTVPSSFKDKPVSLDFGPGLQGKIYLYLNGEFMGVRENTRIATPFSLDLSGKLKMGKENAVAIGIKADRWVRLFGLHRLVKLCAHDLLLDKTWKIKEGVFGQNRGYSEKDFDDSTWEEREIPEEGINPAGNLIWYRKRVRIRHDSSLVAPLRLTLKSTTAKCLIYFNSVLIGRYADVGPQEDFYIYEDLIRKENLVALLVDGRRKGAQLGEISISPYCITRRASLECVF